MNAKESFSVSFLLQPSFLLQHSFLLFSVQPSFFLFFCFSPLSWFCSAPLFLFLFSTPFLVKRLLSTSFSASFLLSSCSPTFLKASPKLVAAQKAQNVLLQKPQRVAPFSSAPLFYSSPFSFQFFPCQLLRP